MAETAAGLEHAAGTVEFIAKLTKSLTVLVIRCHAPRLADPHT